MDAVVIYFFFTNKKERKMNRGGYGGPRPFQPRAQNFAPRFSNNPPRQPQQPVGPAGKVVAFDQCREGKITPVSDNQQLLVNSYDLERPGRGVFQYELKFIADYGRVDQPLEDLSEIPTRHVLASNRRLCLTRLYELLFHQHGAYFEANKFNKNGMYEHVYVYDRAIKFYCSLDMQDRDEQNPFIIDINSMTPDLFDHRRNPKKVFATLKQTQKLEPDTTNGAEMATYLEALFCQHQLDGPERFVKFGSKMFDLKSKSDITGGCELKDGHHKSVRIAENVAELQIDAKISPFHQGLPFLHYLHARFGLGPHDDFCSQSVIGKLAHLKGLFVRTIHKTNNEVFRIRGITSIPADRLTFEDRNGTITSVATYFETIYKMKLEFPHFPCVIKKSGPKEMHYPFEVLEVHQGQKFPKDDMNNMQEQNMIKAAQRLPGTMIEEIENQKKLASINDGDQYVYAAQVRIKPGMKTVKAEVLNAPLITYKNAVPKQVDYAVWDLRDVEFVKPVEINALAIFYNNVQRNTAL
uniref:PAZ domain-containing protein n=1 Tax=Panagrolaimus sp. PS1159 TaxID=55785 RepID=A0AC35F683_9BILA